MKSYPKVLLLCSFSQSTANGITIRNLFKGWPRDRIAVAEFSEGIEAIRVPEIGRYYILGRGEAQFLPPFNLLRKQEPSRAFRDEGGKVGKWEGGKVEDTGQRAEVSGQRGGKIKGMVLAAQRAFLDATGLVLVSKTFRVSSAFETWVREFNPDWIYGTAGDIRKLEFLCQVKGHFGTRLAVHIFDDFINSKHKRTLVPGYWKRRLDRTFRRVCAAADVHLAISEKMAAEYQAKYGPKFHAFHNPIDPAVWLAEGRGQRAEGGGQTEHRSPTAGSMADGECIMAKKKHPPSTISHSPLSRSHSPLSRSDSPSARSAPPSAIRHSPSTINETEPRSFSFLYAGKVNRDTAGALRRFAEVLAELRAEGRDVTLHLHSPYPLEEIRLALGPLADTVYAGKLPYAELPAAFRAADALLLPLDFTPETIEYIRLSLLTKATEFMISGTPIFVFAPKDVATTEYLLAHDAAVHCGDPDRLKEALIAFLDDHATRERVAANALRRAREAHLMEVVNERLRGLLAQA